MRLLSILLMSGALSACVSSGNQQAAPVPPASLGAVQSAAPAASAGTATPYTRRVTNIGTGMYRLPDGTTATAEPGGGFRLPNGAMASPDGMGGIILPNGARCTSDGVGGYLCP